MPKINQEEYEVVCERIVSCGEFWVDNKRYVPVERSKESEEEFSEQVRSFITAIARMKARKQK